MVFVEAAKNERRGKTHEGASDGAACTDGEVKAREVLSVGFGEGDFAMGDHEAAEECYEDGGGSEEDVAFEDERNRGEESRESSPCCPSLAEVEFFSGKAEDEGEKVDCQRKYPEEGEWRDVAAKAVGGGDEEGGAKHGEEKAFESSVP